VTLKIIDAHHHLWDLHASHYPWLMAQGVKRFFGDPAPIQKNYLVEDLRADAAQFDLQASVHIQVGVEPGEELGETEWLHFTGETEGLPSAIVSYCELERPDIEAQIAGHTKYARVRGMRQIVGRSAEEDVRTGSGKLLDDACWVDGLRHLAKAGLSFDLQLIPQQMHRCAEVLSDVPDLDVALCHCGSPWDQSEKGLREWRAGLSELAALENVHCKISGLGMFDHDWSTDSIRPVVETVIEVFGTHRCMFGSNFPVDKLHATYDRVWGAYDEITSGLSAWQRAAMFLENAAAFYRI
jgi:predicted TIM-barrel fold metal-dependent hydrolase